MRPYTDEELVAYADGELPAAQAAEVEQAARTDASVARRIAMFRESRRVLREAFAGRLEEEVPQRLLDVLAEPAGGKVVAFKPRRTRLTTWLPLAAAASVALAVGLGFSGLLSPRHALAPAVADLAMLNTALETKASGVPLDQDGQEVLPLSTLRTASGAWCREYEARRGAAAELQKSHGIACRDAQGQWQPRVIAAAPPSMPETEGGYRTASGSGPNLASALGAARALTPDEEQKQIQQHWQQN